MFTNKVLLVDDESWSLIALHASFNWESFHFQVSAQTSNPFEALELLKTGNFHAAFVDIRMPGMTGLELIQAARLAGIETEFIITSGYADFSYAQEALRYGVFDYLLKPIKSDVTQPLLEKLSNHLAKKRLQDDASRYDHLFRDEVSVLEVLPLPIEAKLYTFWQVVECRGSSIHSDWLEPNSSERHVWALQISHTITVFIINGEQPIHLDSPLSASIQVGISRPSSQMSDTPKLIREAAMALHAQFVRPNEHLFYYQAPQYPKVLQTVDQISIAISCEQDAFVTNLFGRIASDFEQQKLGMEDVQFFIGHMKAQLLRSQSSSSSIPDYLENDDREELLCHFTDFSQLCSYLHDCFVPKSSNELEAEGSSVVVNESFMKLLQDVNRNFDTKIQLSELANRYHLNFTYCCDLFKRTTGKTFMQYMTDLRLQKAEMLLTQTDTSIDIITDKVGFSDKNYFSNVFKKHYHMTPVQYRKYRNAADE